MVYILINSSFCYGIGAHMNDLIVEKNIILIYMAFKNHYNYDKLIKNTNFNENLSIKFYPYKKTTIKNNLPIKTFKIS